MAWYEINNSKPESKKEYLAKVKYEKVVAKSASNFMDIVGNKLEPGIQYRIVTNNSFNAISVYEFIANSEEITEMHIAVYRMNQRAVIFLKGIIDKNKITSNIVVSSFFRENKKYERWATELVAYAQNSILVKIGFTWNHAKIFLAKTKSGKHIVFEGSGNLSDNARIEQYIIEDNEYVFNFHKQWITELLIDGNNK